MAEVASAKEIRITEIEMDKQPLASGGFGKVYKAKWLEDPVVIKVIKAATEREKEEIIDEASLTLCLSHPNVVRLFGITRVKLMKLGIVMEVAEHGSLDKWIGQIHVDKLTKIALGIIDGLTYVHSQHGIHRNIKPKNILMFGPSDDMIPKIADFGVSKLIEIAVLNKTRVGEELYMAPEVTVFGRHSGYPADIYSLAMTLFELFNEQLIRESSDEIKSFIYGVRCGRMESIPESCKVPEYLRSIIQRGLDQDPKNRPLLSEYCSIIHGKYYFIISSCYNCGTNLSQHHSLLSHDCYAVV